MKAFSFIGAGNLGVPFIHALEKAGYQLRFVYRKSKDNSLSPFFQSDIHLLVRSSDFIVIAVQESKIPEVVNELVRSRDLAGKVFFHTANSLTSEELAPLKAGGAAVASLSPLQTFPCLAPCAEDLFRDIVFLLEGDEPAKELGRQITRKLNADFIDVKIEDKIFLHIGAIAASGFLVSLFAFMEKQLSKTSLKHGLEIYFPLVEQTFRNVRTRGLAASLSGPLVRGEIGLIKRHLSALVGKEREFYQILTEFVQLHYRETVQRKFEKK